MHLDFERVYNIPTAEDKVAFVDNWKSQWPWILNNGLFLSDFKEDLVYKSLVYGYRLPSEAEVAIQDHIEIRNAILIEENTSICKHLCNSILSISELPILLKIALWRERRALKNACKKFS